MSALRETQQLAREDLGVGIGLRNVHYDHVLEHWPELDWFEILSDNYIHTDGRPVSVLDRIAERYAVVMHGVALNIGSVDPIDRDYVAELKALRDRCGARFVSDHLCWTGVDGTNVHDLLPVPYTGDALRHVADRVRQVQDQLESPLVLENPSTYLEFAGNELSEVEFLTELVAETGCGLLLDVNNLYVCATNHGFAAEDYLDAVPWDHVVQFHLAGHSDREHYLFDTHDRPVKDDVWALYATAERKSGGRSTLLEWDQHVPTFDEVRAEAWKAKAFRHRERAEEHTG